MPVRTVTNESMSALVAGLRGRPAVPPETRRAFDETFAAQARLSAVMTVRALGRRMDRQARAAFHAAHTQAWADLAANLANWEQVSDELELPSRDRVLLVGWHCPELPRVIAFLRGAQALLVVSHDAPWLEALRRAGCTANFHTPEGRRAIAEGIARRRLVGTMLDHVHAGTETVIAPLLGRPTPFASGLLVTCLTNGYTVAVTGIRGGRLAVVDTFNGTGVPAADAVARIARTLDAEIRRRPERWLMWPSLQSGRRPA